MTQKDKELLLKDLCARLPYGVFMTNKKSRKTFYPLTCDDLKDATFDDDWDDIPYLRPMSSMTENEKKELFYIVMNIEQHEVIEQIKNGDCGIMEGKYHFNSLLEFDWLNKNHFDYRGLIPIGLAIAVTKENNPY